MRKNEKSETAYVFRLRGGVFCNIRDGRRISRMRIVALGVLALALPILGCVQGSEDSTRSPDGYLSELDGSDMPWDNISDDFTGKTRNVVGWGERGVLNISVSCEDGTIMLLPDENGESFKNGQVEAIWDDGEIKPYVFRILRRSGTVGGLSSTSPYNDTSRSTDEWVERLHTHNELRVRVWMGLTQKSDIFDLTNAIVSTGGEATDTFVRVDHVREVFQATGCE